MARYRCGSMFVRDLREHSTPLDRNQVARILHLAERLELRTKAPGARNGCLGLTGLAVLRVLLLRFHNRATGLCCPSYAAIERETGLCRQTVADALARLARAGLVSWVRRLVRVAVDGMVFTRQASNVYRLREPSGDPVAAKPAKPRPFMKRGPLAALMASALVRAESARETETLSRVHSETLTYCRPAHDWRARARSAMTARSLRGSTKI